MSIAAATLADMYEPHERGTKMGIFYSAPLLGPALGPILGGVLTQALGWRSVFWFIMICAVVVLLALVFLFKDTFRKERSLTYQNVLKRRIKEREAHHLSHFSQTIQDVKLSLADVNPFPPLLKILARSNNLAILFSSGECP